jgi:hypothetical protein
MCTSVSSFNQTPSVWIAHCRAARIAFPMVRRSSASVNAQHPTANHSLTHFASLKKATVGRDDCDGFAYVLAANVHGSITKHDY